MLAGPADAVAAPACHAGAARRLGWDGHRGSSPLARRQRLRFLEPWSSHHRPTPCESLASRTAHRREGHRASQVERCAPCPGKTRNPIRTMVASPVEIRSRRRDDISQYPARGCPLHHRLPVDSELCQAIAVLARAHQDGSGGAPQHIISCGRCCVSFTRSSWLSSPAGSRWV